MSKIGARMFSSGSVVLKKWSQAVVLTAVALAILGTAGCKKSEEEKRQEALVAQVNLNYDVSDEQKVDAQKRLKKVWDSLRADVDRRFHPSGDQRNYYLDLMALTRNGQRLAGYENGSLAAGRYVEDRLKAMGVPKIIEQAFPLVQPKTKSCTLTVDGKTYPIYAMRPNGLVAPATSAKGITGKTLYAGSGELSEYGKEMVEGRIVVLDYESRQRWMNAFAFGARAVIFIGADKPVFSPVRHMGMPANLPRYYIPADLAEKLQLNRPDVSKEITLHASFEWTELLGRNVIGFIPGTGSGGKEQEAIVLAVPLDSLSEVPALSPGARDAANIAALLRVAEFFSQEEHRLPRDLFLCFFDGQSLDNLGARAFYGVVGRNDIKDGMPLAERLGGLDAERRQIQAIRDMLTAGKENLFSPEARKKKHYTAAVNMMKDEAVGIDSRIQEELLPLRLEIQEEQSHQDELEKQLADKQVAQQTASGKAAETLKSEIVALNKQIAETGQRLQQLDEEVYRLEVEDLAWNSLQRVLYEGLNPYDPQALQSLYKPEQTEELQKRRQRLIEITPQRMDDLIKHARTLCDRRLDELTGMIARAEQNYSLYDFLYPQPGRKKKIILHMAMNLSDARKRWAFVRDESAVVFGQDTLTAYSSLFGNLRSVVESGIAGIAPDFDARTISSRYMNNMALFVPGARVDSTPCARMVGIQNLSIITILDRLPRQGQPADTVAALKADFILDQAGQVAGFLNAAFRLPELIGATSIKGDGRVYETKWTGSKVSGPSVKRIGAGSAMADQLVRDALVAVYPTQAGAVEAIPGFTSYLVMKTNTNGMFEVPAVTTKMFQTPHVVSAMFDNRSIRQQIPPGTASDVGLISSINNTESYKASADLSKTSIILFGCQNKTVVGFGYNRGSVASKVLQALSTGPMPEDRSLVCEAGYVIAVYAATGMEGFKIFNPQGMVLLNNKPTEAEYTGKGISLADPTVHPVTSKMTATDLANLDTERLRNLRDVKISQPSLDAIHSKASALLEDAQAAVGKAPASYVYATQEVAAAYSRQVYKPLVGVMNDLVTAVVLLLLLAIPFAYALERLLIDTPHIYRQIGWFAVFFLATFGLLYVVNPAFRIAATPIIIFLAFAIILLSSLVIFIMVRKLQVEVRKMQGLASTVHTADVSRLSTTMAAVHMGISTMRRRPLRTLLTAVTVVLLTFTILTFASFGSSWGTRKTYQNPLSGRERIMLRHALWSGINNEVCETLQYHLADEADVIPRVWVAPSAGVAKSLTDKNKTFELLITSADTREAETIGSAVGIDPKDLEYQPELRQLLRGDPNLLNGEGNGIFLTEVLCREFGLTDADIGKTTLLLSGRPVVYAGVLSEQAESYTSLEGSSILPVDYQSGGDVEETSKAEGSTEEASDIESAQFVRYNLDRVAVVSSEMAATLGGGIRSVRIYPKHVSHVEEIAKQVATITAMPTYYGAHGAVQRLMFTSLTRASGWKDLLIPVALGGLIIFATMLGSVSDREKEIYTFSSLGLAPKHVASLFFAEASMYAVIGGMGGYLLGQAVARLLSLFSQWITVPTMNYSSTNAIITILIVMGTVMVSTIYPAIKASRAANPGIQRRWKIQKPEGNLCDLVFPFTVSAYDITGVVSFLKEHFDNYSDSSLGVFTAIESRIFRQKNNDMLGFQAKVALAPFDLGVMQRFVLLSQPSEIEGIDEVRILMQRLSGAQGDWKRAIQVFAGDLRKQLLIWRSVPADVMEKYRQKTMEIWDSLPVEEVSPETLAAEYEREATREL